MNLKDPIEKAAYMARWARARHKQRLANGLCTKCGLRAPVKGFKCCDVCKLELRQKRRRFIDAGVCTNCGKPRRTKRFIYCKACRRLRLAQYHKDEHVHGRRKARNGKLKREAFEAYGGPNCACCGETHIEFLSIDHIDGKGAAHRKSLKLERRGGGNFYYWLKNNGFPAGYRVLCMNCNFALGHFGACPHGNL